MVARMTAAQYTAWAAARRGETPAPAAPKKPRKKKAAAAHPGLPSIPPAPDVAELRAMLSAPGRDWTLLMPCVEKMLTSNGRLHHMAVHKIRRQLREHGAQMARAHRVPRLERAAIFYVLHPRTINRKRDPGNWADTAKPYVDGLVDGGVLPDDNHEYLLGPIPIMGAPVTTGPARMSLVIVELLAPLTSTNAKTVTETDG